LEQAMDSREEWQRRMTHRRPVLTVVNSLCIIQMRVTLSPTPAAPRLLFKPAQGLNS
jgi:hypothetical protein